MDQSLFELLSAINRRGFRAFFVGGVVRDYLMFNTISNDIDIATSAPSDLICEIFAKYKPKKLKYDTVKFKYHKYNVDVAHFRNEYTDGNEVIIELTKEIKKDADRRDFTVNNVYMDKDGKIYVFNLLSKLDIKLKVIRFQRRIDYSLSEDPSRLLRYIYFTIKYNLEPVPSEIIYIKRYGSKHLKLIDVPTINKYLFKILSDCNIDVFIQFMRDNNMYNVLFNSPIDVPNITKEGFFACSKYRYEKTLSKPLLKKVKRLRSIIASGEIRPEMIFHYGVNLCYDAAKIMGISKKSVREIFDSMVIKKRKELNISLEDIMNITKKDKEYCTGVFNSLINLVLYKKLKNDYNILIDYVKGGFINDIK